ncbi:MAG TPA: tetratricopeptide repeat protein [Nostocaceae cyanobacterium]|nr:tetratricopeptide repeat protein [Nostocaceae cyanobacterium]
MIQDTLQLKTLSSTIISLILITLSAPSFAQEGRLIFISEVKGNVKFKQPIWKSYQTAHGGELLGGSDKLRLVKGASVKVVCDNLQVWNLNSQGEFEVAKGCPSSTRPVLKRPGNITSPTRAGNDQKIPYLISPRNTSISTLQPTLRWNSVKGATSYQVQILGPEVDWTTKVNQSEVVYSGNKPLKPGFRYRVIITASNGASTKDKDNSGFTVLSDADNQRVKTDIVNLQQQLLSNESKNLALAHLYRTNNLNADAIELLEGLTKKGNKTIAVYQLLGNIYQQIGLTELAKERYLTALKLAKAENNLAAQAIIQSNLGEVDITLDQLKQALQWFQEAQKSYLDLGDETKEREMQQQVDDLKRRIS